MKNYINKKHVKVIAIYLKNSSTRSLFHKSMRLGSHLLRLPQINARSTARIRNIIKCPVNIVIGKEAIPQTKPENHRLSNLNKVSQYVVQAPKTAPNAISKAHQGQFTPRTSKAMVRQAGTQKSRHFVLYPAAPPIRPKIPDRIDNMKIIIEIIILDCFCFSCDCYIIVFIQIVNHNNSGFYL